MLTVQNAVECCSSLVGIDTLSVIETAVNIIATALGGFCALKGVQFLTILKKKRITAMFSFWIQLRVRVEELKNALISDNSILNGLYSADVRLNWGNTSIGASDEAVKRFYDNVQESLQFIKNTSDQIPVNKKWLQSYIKLVDFLLDVTRYDIRDLNSYFMFSGSETINDRNKYCEGVCNNMSNLLKDIVCEQEKTANKF